MYSIQKHLAYNAWANRRIANMLKNIPEKDLFMEYPSSFKNIYRTVLHIWDAEVIWFTRIQGGQITNWPSEHFTGSPAEALDKYPLASEELLSFIKDKDSSFLESIVRYKNLKGMEYAQPVEDILFHVVNHGSYHRGQIITLLRLAGHSSIENTDLIAFLRQQ
ncbi:MAG: DinB family protein [Chitinophagales bacterium]|nr:DinB family protein [Chitinophagales bacterium]MDW8272655.1 DinB family protein [Chitinophagales bacterium]